MRFEVPGSANAGTYTWEGDATKVTPSSGTFTVEAQGTGENTLFYGNFAVTFLPSVSSSVDLKVRDDANTVRAVKTLTAVSNPAFPRLPSANFERLPNGEVKAVRGSFPAGYSTAGVLVQAWVEPMYQDGLGWVYNPPARSDAEWSEQELLTGKSLYNKTAGYTVYQGYLTGSARVSA